MNNRIVDHPVLGTLEKRKKVTFIFDGQSYDGLEGDTIASALLANGIRTLRVHEETETPRGIYCNIGHCFECRVTVNDEIGMRACLETIKPNMHIRSGTKQADPLKPTEAPLPRTYAEFVAKETDGGNS